MPRGAKKPSEVFADVMAMAKKQLLANAEKAEAFAHKGLRGDERASQLISFLEERLPDRFAVTKGEAIDFQDNRTGQLDVVVYDKHTCPPLLEGGENALLPAEAVYAIIEVKTTLTQDELDSCYKHAKKVRSLLPFKKNFIAARVDGAAADDHNPRCIYTVFAYKTNLSDSDWAQKEFDRVKKSSASQKAKIDSIDRIIVLTRGFLIPGSNSGKEEKGDTQSIFLDFYLHLMNFISREVARRPPMDWQLYGPRTSPGWTKLS